MNNGGRDSINWIDRNELGRYQPCHTCNVHRERDDFGRYLTGYSGRKEQSTKSTVKERFLNPYHTRVALFDLETTGLKGDFDIILCCVLKTFGVREHPKVFYIDLSWGNLVAAECNLIKRITEAINNYDGLIGYYSSRFDMPMLRTRQMYHGIPRTPKMKHLDVYFSIKRHYNPSSRRMDRINEILKINKPEGSPDKTRIGIEYWMNAMFGRSQQALDYIVDHCIKDVEILENIVNENLELLPDRIIRM